MFYIHKRRLRSILAIVLAGILCLFITACAPSAIIDGDKLPSNDNLINGERVDGEQKGEDGVLDNGYSDDENSSEQPSENTPTENLPTGSSEINSDDQTNNAEQTPTLQWVESYAVTFIDVGDGDSILISLPDGKNMLIDCGQKSESNFNAIISVLEKRKVKVIDYFLLTHTDSDHIGNAVEIIEQFSVGKIFMPKIPSVVKQEFPKIAQVLELAEQKQISVSECKMLTKIAGENYFIGFLSPKYIKGDLDCPYYELAENPMDENARNNLSPIVYFECLNVRFLFTGDASQSQERFVVEQYNVGYYDLAFSDVNYKVRLEDIDYLKVAHHGSADSSCQELLQLLKAKNAVLSVGAFGKNPSTEAINRILQANESCNILRTDVLGNVCVSVNASGQSKILK